MSVEARRGCGYRKVGGLYMMGGGIAAPCDRMPYALDRCPTCGAGVKFSRGHTWLKPDFFSVHGAAATGMGGILRGAGCRDKSPCPVCRNAEFGPHLLLWIGRAHYSPDSYLDESRKLGISRRIAAVPKGLVIGETWVLLAHLDAISPKLGEDRVPICAKCGKEHSKHVARPSGIGFWCPCDKNGDSPGDYEPSKPTPGIFAAFIPTRLELLLKESDATDERREKEQKRGVTVVAVPDDDKDHQGSVWDSPQEELPGVAP